MKWKMILKKAYDTRKVHQDGVEHAKFFRVAKCNSLREIEAKINLMIQLEVRLNTP